DKLIKLGIQVPLDCVLCASTMEIFDHLYFGCPNTSILWDRILRWLGITRKIGSWKDELVWISSIAKRKNGKAGITTAAFAMVVYCIWCERNSIRFNKGRYMVDEICKEIAIHMHIQG
ncbi:hypothetical protein A4A49_63406, partial [Nicotiana attenuata]